MDLHDGQKTTRLFWMKHVAGNEVARETCSLVGNSVGSWGHVCQNDHQYLQRMTVKLKASMNGMDDC